jgi:hypothetical protein
MCRGMKHLVTVALIAALGCGSRATSSAPSNTADTTAAAAPAATPAPTGPGVYGGTAYGGFRRTPELTAFHDLIAARTGKDACPVSGQLNTAAAAIAKAPSPAGPDPDGMWSGEANNLSGIAEDFVTNCAGTDVAMIEYDVASMHRSFQRLLLQLRGP